MINILCLFFCNGKGWFSIQFWNYILKYPSSKQNAVLLLPSMKLSYALQNMYLLYQTCMLVYILLGLVPFLVLQQLAHGWQYISLYQWVIHSLLHCPLHQSLQILFANVLHSFPSSFHHSPSCSSGYVSWFHFALESATGEEYWILEGLPFQRTNLKH